jgi:hypothetical protein
MLLQERLEALEIDIALEWMRRRRVKALGGRKVDRLRSGGLDIAARRVEMGVRGLIIEFVSVSLL